MRFRLSADVECHLEQNGASVQLDPDELSELPALLAGAVSGSEGLDLLKRLFSIGIIEPDAAAINAPSTTTEVRARIESSCLAPWLRTHVRFVAGDTSIPRGEAATGLFLEPEIVAAASDLSNQLRSALDSVTVAAAVRGRNMSRGRVQALVEDIARSWCSRLGPSVPIRSTSEAGHIRLDVPAELTSTGGDPVQSWMAELTFVNEAASGSVHVAVGEIAGVARVLESVARGEAPPPNLLSPSVLSVLALIERVGGWIDKEQRPRRYTRAARDPRELAVTHMGHACLIVDSVQTRILVDPWLFPWDADNDVQPLTADQLGKIDAICFTHHHDDHFDLSSLLVLPHDVPIIVPKEEHGPFAPRLGKLLGLFGFSDVHPLAPGETLVVGELEVEAVPFFGEGRDLLGFPGSCFSISLGDVNILVHADASPDSSGASLTHNGALKDLLHRRGAFDVVFGSWWQERAFRCMLSPFAPLMPNIQPADWLVDNEQCDCSTEYLEQLVRGGEARLFVTYAESGQELFRRESRRSAYVSTISLAWTSWDEVASHLRTTTGASVVAAQPYLVVTAAPTRPPATSAALFDESGIGPAR